MTRFGPGGDAVMDDRAVGPEAGDGRKRDVLEDTGVAAEILQRLDGVDLGQSAGRGLAVEPGEKARHGGAVAPVRRPCARHLGRVFHRLHQGDRIGAAPDLAAAGGDEACDRVGGAGGVEPHVAVRGAERLEVALESAGLADVGEPRQDVAHRIAELAAVHIERGLSFARHDRDSERERRMGDVAAADVEGPADRMRIRDHERVGLEPGELGADAVELLGRRLAGKFLLVRHDRTERRRRAVGPDGVDRVGLGRHEAGADGRAGLGKSLRALDGVQPRGRSRASGLRAASSRSTDGAASRSPARSRTGPCPPARAPAAYSGRRRTARRDPPARWRCRPSRKSR